MGQVVQVNGDYNIKTAEAGIITLDTGPNVGFVRVTGNLIVEGDTLTVSAENLNVQDNIIILNFGETGAGVTLGYSGIQIDRGSLSDGLFVFDEASDSWLIGQGDVTGTISYTDSNLRLRRIYTNSTTDGGDLTLIGAGTGVVKVLGTLNYEQQITDDDDIPNKKYVDDAIQSNPTFQILRGNTRVVSFDKDDPLPPTPLNFPPPVGPYTTQPADEVGLISLISIVVDGQINSEFFSNRAKIQGLEIIGTEIINNDTSTNISILTNDTGRLVTNAAVQLDKINYTPSATSEHSVFYAKNQSAGTTGLWYVNSSSDGELVSKNRALLFSMIF